MDAQLIQKVNATALGFLLPIRFIDFSFLTSRNQKIKTTTPFLCAHNKDECFN